MSSRERLFRGKRVDNGEWVEGGICQTENWTSIFFVNDFPGSASTFDPPSCELEEYDVIPETVGQYTGLTDKNGNKIFEGDVLEGIRMGRKERAEVVWIPEILAFGLKYSFRDTPVAFNASIFYKYLKHAPDELVPKIIGTIHDNPELLEESE